MSADAPCLAQRELVGATQAQLENFGTQLAHRSAIGSALVYLLGDLGAGKTTLVRQILRSLGFAGRVKSPTYALMESYSVAGATAGATAAFDVYHFDFYRLESSAEWEEAGFRDIFAGPGLKLVEWPQKAGNSLPQPDCVIGLTVDTETTRHLMAKAYSRLGASLLE